MVIQTSICIITRALYPVVAQRLVLAMRMTLHGNWSSGFIYSGSHSDRLKCTINMYRLLCCIPLCSRSSVIQQETIHFQSPPPLHWMLLMNRLSPFIIPANDRLFSYPDRQLVAKVALIDICKSIRGCVRRRILLTPAQFLTFKWLTHVQLGNWDSNHYFLHKQIILNLMLLLFIIHPHGFLLVLWLFRY